MLRTRLGKLSFWIMKPLMLDDPRAGFSWALILLIATAFLISPPMRFFRSDTLALVLISGIFYKVVLGLVALAQLDRMKVSPKVHSEEKLQEFAVTMPRWIQHTLLSLSRNGWARRRRDLKLTRKRSRILAELGLAEESQHGKLVITQLGRTVASIVAGREAGFTSSG